MLSKRNAGPTAWRQGGPAQQGHSGHLSSTLAPGHCTAVFFNGQGKPVGELRDGWLVKHVKTFVHQLRRPEGWATDAEHIAQLRTMGGRGIKLIDETGRTWTATLDVFDYYAQPINRGFGAQLALAVAHWTVRAPGQLAFDLGA